MALAACCVAVMASRWVRVVIVHAGQPACGCVLKGQQHLHTVGQRAFDGLAGQQRACHGLVMQGFETVAGRRQAGQAIECDNHQTQDEGGQHYDEAVRYLQLVPHRHGLSGSCQCFVGNSIM